MSHTKSALQILLCLIALPCKAGQSTQPSAPQATALLQQTLTALTGGHTLTDVTLSGTAERIAGSDDETGTVTVKALAAGAARIELNLSSGLRSETMNISASPAGSWSGPDATTHRIADHNLLLLDPAWFFPLFPISRGLATGYTATYIGQETRNGKAVQHIAIAQTSGVQLPSGTPSVAHLSQMDFFLDVTTLLPVAATFNIHLDNDAGRDIPIEVQFSDYRNVSGAQIPFHLQKFLNNGLILDLQFSSAATNTGLSATEFAASAQ
jgi:hypothetical protein